MYNILARVLCAVPMEELRCPAEEEGEGEEEVCGSDGETYTSRCALIQSTSGVEVAHSGPCDMDECDGLMVGGLAMTSPEYYPLRLLHLYTSVLNRHC